MYAVINHLSLSHGAWSLSKMRFPGLVFMFQEGSLSVCCTIHLWDSHNETGAVFSLLVVWSASWDRCDCLAFWLWLMRSPLFCRDSVMEILFEQDNEEKSVASLILDALVKVNESKVKSLSMW